MAGAHGGLLAALEQVRMTGHAVDESVLGPGIGYLAAPVVARDGLPLGAVGTAFVVGVETDQATGVIADAVQGLAQRLAAGGGAGVLVTQRGDGAEPA